MAPNIVYKIRGPQYWSVRDANFIAEDAIDPLAEVVPLESSDGADGIAYLRETLKFYGYPLGALATPEDKLRELIAVNREYLLTILILRSLDLDIPEEALSKYEEIRASANDFSETTVTGFMELGE